MLNPKPHFDRDEHPAKLLRMIECSICGHSFVGHFSRRQCSDPCRAEAIRRRGRVSQQRIRDERRTVLRAVKCQWCKEKTPRQRRSKKYCTAQCRSAASRTRRAKPSAKSAKRYVST